MGLVRKIKSFLTKESYDFDRPDIDLHNFHPHLRPFYMITGVFFNNVDSKIRFILPFVNMILVGAALTFETMFVFHGVATGDFAFACESLCYIMIVGTTPTIYLSTMLNKNLIIEQVEEMNRDFHYIRTLGPRFRKCFIDGQLKIWQMGLIWVFFCTMTSFVYVINTLVLLAYQSLFSTIDETAVRPLIFPLWLPNDDPYRSPNYEIFMLVEIMIVMIVNQSFGCYVYMQVHLMMHYHNLMSLIEIDLDILLDGLDETVANLPKDDPRRMEVQGILRHRIRRIVTWHQAVFKAVSMISSVFGPPLAYQVFFSSFAICIMAFQIAEQLEQGEFNILFAFLDLELCIQLWIPCYLGTVIETKSLSIADACWNCGWEKKGLGRLICLELSTIIIRAQKPLTIKFYSLPSLTLETYSSMLSASYTYFNMLRQSTKH